MVSRWMLLLTIVSNLFDILVAIPTAGSPQVHIQVNPSTGGPYITIISTTADYLTYTYNQSAATLFTIDSNNNYVNVPAASTNNPGLYSSGWAIPAGSGSLTSGTKEILKDSVSGLGSYRPMTCTVTDATSGAMTCIDYGAASGTNSWAFCGYASNELYNYNPSTYAISSQCGSTGTLLVATNAFRAVYPPVVLQGALIEVPPPPSSSSSSSVFSSSGLSSTTFLSASSLSNQAISTSSVLLTSSMMVVSSSNSIAPSLSMLAGSSTSTSLSLSLSIPLPSLPSLPSLPINLPPQSTSSSAQGSSSNSLSTVSNSQPTSPTPVGNNPTSPTPTTSTTSDDSSSTSPTPTATATPSPSPNDDNSSSAPSSPDMTPSTSPNTAMVFPTQPPNGSCSITIVYYLRTSITMVPPSASSTPPPTPTDGSAGMGGNGSGSTTSNPFGCNPVTSKVILGSF